MRAAWWTVAMLVTTPMAAASADEQACPDTVRRALLPARIDAPVAQACKRAPDAPTQWLATLAYEVPGRVNDAGGRNLVQITAVLDDGGTVLASNTTLLEEDAALHLQDGAFRIDTARYHLAPGQRAFGVVLHNSANGPSCPDARYGDELTLYVRAGRALQPVFSTYLGVTVAVHGPLCFTSDRSNVSDDATITLSMGEGRSHGFADIVSSAKVERWFLKDDKTVQRGVFRRTFRYDGTRYRPGDTSADATLYWDQGSTTP